MWIQKTKDRKISHELGRKISHELGIFLSNGQASKGDGRLDEHTVQNGILLVHAMMVHEIV
jgi:hypothetical protein